jgi:hypothetical protein
MRSGSALSFVLFSAAIAVGCSPSPPATAQVNSSTVSGTVGSSALTVTSVIAEFVNFFPTAGGPPVPALRILFSNKANTCGGIHFASSTFLDVRLVAVSPVHAGTFPIENAANQTPADGQAEADFDSVDGACNDVVTQTATTGSLTIKGAHFSASPLNVAGSIDVTFAGGHFSGDFNASYCGMNGANGPDAGAITTCTQ